MKKEIKTDKEIKTEKVKTTTLRMVAGFEDLSDGEVWVGDRLLSSPKKHHYTPPENA